MTLDPAAIESLESMRGQPNKAEVDGVSAEVSIKDQIALERFLASQQSVGASSTGLRIMRIVPPGAR